MSSPDPTSRGALVLVVDDEAGILSSLATILRDEGHRTVEAPTGEEGLRRFDEERPDVVLLDIWLPDKDGLEVLAALRARDASVPVVMMSGHGTVGTAVRAIKMGAFDYLEKPLSYDATVRAVDAALEARREHRAARSAAGWASDSRPQAPEARPELAPPPSLPQLRTVDAPQRTIRQSAVIYGLGLHSGTRTGMVIQPLPPDTGIHFHTLPTGTLVPAHVSWVADTDYATTLSREGASIKTIEHLLSALHAYGVTNLLVKVHGEVPVLDGSALEFCKLLEEVGLEDQAAPRRELVVDRVYEVGAGSSGKRLTIEPAERFSVSYLLRYPPPVGEQEYAFTLDSPERYREEIAPARTFGFMRDLKMMNELGLGSGGRLDNFILVGDSQVLNTELRFPDEFVRHKILDIVGDLYLIGYPVRGKVTARLTGHRDNIALLRQIVAGVQTPATI